MGGGWGEGVGDGLGPGMVKRRGSLALSGALRILQFLPRRQTEDEGP